MKVLQVAAPSPMGGLESVLLALGLELHRSGVETHAAIVVQVSPEKHPVVRTFREAGVPVHPIVVSGRGYLRERKEVGRLIRSLRPQVVHTHGHRADVIDSGVARRMGIPTVTTLHGSSYLSWRTALYEWLQMRMLRRFDAVLAVSRPLVSPLRKAGVPSARIHVVPNAWDSRFRPLDRDEARRVLGLPRGAFVIGWVGRLISVKGCDVLIRAMAHLQDLPVHASIVGDGPRWEALETLVEELGLEDRVHLHGAREGAAKLFPAFDVWALSSRSEGTPMVLFEAMAAEVPIVATRVGGVEDVVSEEEAWLVPPDDPTEMAHRLREVFMGGAHIRARAAAARKRVEEDFSVDAWVQRHIEVYRALLPESPRPGGRRWSRAAPRRRSRPDRTGDNPVPDARRKTR